MGEHLELLQGREAVLESLLAPPTSAYTSWFIHCTRQALFGRHLGYIVLLAWDLLEISANRFFSCPCRSLSLEAYGLLLFLNLFVVINTVLLNIHYENSEYFWNTCILPVCFWLFKTSTSQFPEAMRSAICFVTKYSHLSESRWKVRDWWLNCLTVQKMQVGAKFASPIYGKGYLSQPDYEWILAHLKWGSGQRWPSVTLVASFHYSAADYWNWYACSWTNSAEEEFWPFHLLLCLSHNMTSGLTYVYSFFSSWQMVWYSP